MTVSEKGLKIIELHERQHNILIDDSRFRVLVAGRRFGKTILALTEILKHAEQKSKIWYIAPTYKQAELIAWKMLQDMIPRELVSHKNEVKLQLDLINGSEISLKGADNEDSLRGVGLNFVVLDEYAMMKSSVWYTIVRPMLTDTKGKALFIGTPQGKNSLWEFYVKGQRGDDEFKSWCYRTIDNPYIDPEEVEKAKQELPDRQFKQEYEASFEDYVGLVYPEFNKEHIIDPFYLPTSYPRVGAIDTAVTGTTGVLKAAIDEDGVLFIYYEYYEANKRVSEVAEAIKEDNVRWFIDPQAHEKQVTKHEKLSSLYDEYGDCGIHPTNAQKDVYAGINRVGELLKSGKIKIFSTCKNLIWELERYHWSEMSEGITGERKPLPYKKDDHLCLVGDAKILMADMTEKPISDVLIGDYVQTSKRVQRVIDSQLTGIDIKVHKLTLSTGQTLEATAGHPIYTNKGKKRLDSLRYGDIIKTWNISYSKVKNIVGTENTIARLADVPKAVNAFMLLSGKMLTALCQKVCAYIILTVTQRITSYQISPAFQGQNTLQATPCRTYQTKIIENEIKNIWHEYAHSLRNGTPLQKVENGMVSIVKKHGKIGNLLVKSVSSVKNNSGVKTGEESIAPIIARPSIEDYKAQTWKQGFVLSAKTLLKSINTLIPKPAHVVALDVCTHRRAVYNLTVEKSHNYYANGILVSNCDDLRYIAMSRQSKYEVPEPPINKNSAWGQHLLKQKEKNTFTYGRA